MDFIKQNKAIVITVSLLVVSALIVTFIYFKNKPVTPPKPVTP